ncbi:MAG: YchJ family protein [Gammaproteobacteria bacterium]|nr:MAG: YchJ family protein [Gammaproteobacteria bacterium]UTW41407.1 YchJ family protein [bacterium SCSIO 12844]
MITKNNSKELICPCKSKLNYDQCCKIAHDNHQSVQTAEQLMRSRYSAYVLKLVDYIVETTHPQKRSKNLYLEIAQWAEKPKWLNLEIMSKRFGQANDKVGFVEFKALYLLDGKEQFMHENSKFKKFSNKWYYFDGKLK